MASTADMPLSELLARIPPADRAKILDEMDPADAQTLYYDWEGTWARPEQREPEGDWYRWALITGRGWGKTRTGVEYIRKRVIDGRGRRIAIIGETTGDVRDVIIQGESGLLNISNPDDRPRYIEGRRRIDWPNGAIGLTFSGREPDQVRGHQFDTALVDEFAKYFHPQTLMDNLDFCMRLSSDPRIVIMTTPRAIAPVKALVADDYDHGGDTKLTHGSSYDNVINLSPRYKRNVLAKHEGTRLGLQEIYGRILDDNPHAPFHMVDIEENRVLRPISWSEVADIVGSDFVRVVVGIDPATTSDPDSSNETGIIVAGLTENEHVYIIADYSGIYPPLDWATEAAEAFIRHDADDVVGEVNQGGEMVEAMMRSVSPLIPFTPVRASRGKITRAEPIGSLYKQGRVHHMGIFLELEDQMTNYQPGADSPDRMDALVWAVTTLLGIDIPEPLEAFHLVSKTKVSRWRNDAIR